MELTHPLSEAQRDMKWLFQHIFLPKYYPQYEKTYPDGLKPRKLPKEHLFHKEECENTYKYDDDEMIFYCDDKHRIKSMNIEVFMKPDPVGNDRPVELRLIPIWGTGGNLYFKNFKLNTKDKYFVENYELPPREQVVRRWLSTNPWRRPPHATRRFW